MKRISNRSGSNERNNVSLLTLSIIILGMLMSATVYSQTAINLWDGTAPFNKKGIQVQEINKNARISRVTVPQLFHYASQVKSAAQKPAIVIFPGGGYVREAFDHEGTKVAEWFSALGFDAFVVKYRLPDDDLFDNSCYVPLMDAQQAVYWVRKHAAQYGIDPHNIGVIGFSAGGHLAASASTLFGDPVNEALTTEDVRPDFSLLIYPVISMSDAYTHAGSKRNLIGDNPTDELTNHFSLENQVTETTPKTFMIHAFDDGSVPVANTEMYATNLAGKGVDVTKIIIPRGGHGFGFRTTGAAAYWTGYLETWLRANVLGK
ncbi:alpha/beta hydrolase [Geofilum sp. OHC36d9]|uniref:alpha/beta hydrolase n=1 Tax=Geofilum sp. OHC36d9 TaxID=3458413 RepID=UPI00403327B4